MSLQASLNPLIASPILPQASSCLPDLQLDAPQTRRQKAKGRGVRLVGSAGILNIGMGSRCLYPFRRRGQSPFVPLIITAIFGTSAVVSRLTDTAAVLTTVGTANVGWLRTLLRPTTLRPPS